MQGWARVSVANAKSRIQSHPVQEGPRVLIVRLGAIGDVVNTLVLACAIRRNWPGAHIAWIVHPTPAPLLHGHPAVDDLIVLPRRGLHHWLRAVKRLRSGRYDLAIDAQRLAKSALLARLSGAPRVLGFDRNRCRELSWLFHSERIEPHDPQRHVVDQYLEFASHLGFSDLRVQWDLSPTPDDEAALSSLLPEDGSPLALIALGGGKPANRWTAAGFARLATRLAADEGMLPCFVGGQSGEGLLSRAVEALIPAGTPHLNLVGKIGLRALLALMKRAELHVGCDTGATHLAVAAGVPSVVSLFGPANPRRTGPYGHLDHVVQPDLWCSPCFRKHPCHKYVCMPSIEVTEVLDSIRRARSTASPRHPSPQCR